MTMPVIEPSNFSVDKKKFDPAKKWWQSQTEAQQKALIRTYKIVTWEHVINAHERELAK